MMDSTISGVRADRLRQLIHLPLRGDGHGSGLEGMRLDAVKRASILGHHPDYLYDRVARMAALLCETPAALVTFIGEERQWCRAAHGCDGIDVARQHAFCARAIEAEEALVVADTTLDERFMHSPLVTEHGIRFYAGVPLRSPEGFGLGALCVIDFEPRALEPERLEMLEDLAGIVQRDLDARRATYDFRGIFARHPLPMWIFEIETLRILAVNASALRQYGYGREDFLSMRLTDLPPSADVPELLATITRFNGEGGRSGPMRHVRADGSIIWADVALQAVVYEGRPAVLVVASDVTEQVIWKRAHEVTGQRFRMLVDAVDDYAIILLDPVGRVVSWNPGACRLYGLSEQDVLGRPAADLFPDDEDRKEAYCARLHAELFDGPFRIEARQLRAGAGSFWADLLLTPIHDGKGRHVGFAQITHDATLRREHEQSLIEERERAEQLNQITSHHLIQLSRQLRTPLTGIIGAAEVLNQQLSGEDAEFVDTIRRNGESLLEALETAVEYVQLHGELAEPVLSELDLGKEATTAVERYAGRARQHGLTIEVQTRETRVEALGHDDLLQRALNQLIRNALQFTEEGGVVIRTGSDARGPFIRVADSGIGIAAEFLERVFEPFTQEDPDNGRAMTGCGLGLPVALRQVERMGGTITAESEQGSGSCFTVRLRPASG